MTTTFHLPRSLPTVAFVALFLTMNVGLWTSASSQELPLPPLVCPEGFVLLPSGTVTLGSPKTEPNHESDEALRTVSMEPMCVQEHETTVAEWESVTGQASESVVCTSATCPHLHSSWYDATRFANRMSQNHGLEVCYEQTGCEDRAGYACERTEIAEDCDGFRLPTSDEWEYAARAWETGRTYGRLEDIANFGRDPAARGGGMIVDVGEYEPNQFGLYDMLGNATEWTEDCSKDRTVEGLDHARDCPTRDLRGGTHAAPRELMRLADRIPGSASGGYYTGFRLVVAPTRP